MIYVVVTKNEDSLLQLVLKISEINKIGLNNILA